MEDNDFNSLIVDNLIDGIMLIDSKGIIKQVNKAACEIFGFSPEELISTNVSQLMPLPHSKAHDTYLTNYLNTGNAKIIGIGRDVEAVRKNGETFPMELSITESKKNGESYFIGFIRDLSEQKQSEELLKLNSKIMRAVNSALASFINADIPKRDIFDSLLEKLLDITQSEYGFIGEILRKEDATPYLRTYAITDISWNQETRAFYRDNVRNGLSFYNLATLFGITIRTGESVISNDPGSDPRSGGLPPGHPPLKAYLGLPIYSGNMLVGMAGVSNRPGGFDEELVYQIKPFLGAIGNIIAGYHNLASRRKAEHELYAAQQTLRKLASTDALTGINNRASLYLSLQDVFNRFRGSDNSLSLMFVDIDHFKNVNDTYGHLMGDRVLTGVAGLLKRSIRPDDIIGRYGGEEIIVAMPNCSAAKALEISKRIMTEITETEFELEGKSVSVTISVGIASTDTKTKSVEALIENADRAVYQAKEAGRNCAKVFGAKGEENRKAG